MAVQPTVPQGRCRRDVHVQIRIVPTPQLADVLGAQVQEDVKHLKDQRSRLQMSASSAAAKAEVCLLACCISAVSLPADVTAGLKVQRARLKGMLCCVQAWALPRAERAGCKIGAASAATAAVRASGCMVQHQACGS